MILHSYKVNDQCKEVDFFFSSEPQEIETSIVASGLGGIPTFTLFGGSPAQDTELELSIGDTADFYLTLTQEGFSVELVNLFDTSYADATTTASGGYPIELEFLDPDVYQIRARAYHAVSGIYYYSLNTIQVTVS